MLTGSIAENMWGSPFSNQISDRWALLLPPSFPDDPTNPVNLLSFNDGTMLGDTQGTELVGDTAMPDGYDPRACCYTSVGADTLTVTGLLGTDTVEVPTGSATPALTNDTITFSIGLKYWELTIKRAGVIIAFFTCGEESGNYAINSVKTGVLGGVNGSITTSDIDALHTRLTDGKGYDHNVNGLTISDGASYYYDDAQTLLIPDGVYIPPVYESTALCSAYLANGNPAPLQYKPVATYPVELVGGPALEASLSDSFTPSVPVTVVSTLGTAVLSSDGTTVTTAGTLYKIVLSTGAILSCAEGSGVWLYSDRYETDGIKFEITTSDIGALWAGTQDSYFPHAQSGYYTDITDDGVFYPYDKDGTSIFVAPSIYNGGLHSWKHPEAKELIKADLLANLAGTGPYLFDSGGLSNTFTDGDYATGGVFNNNRQYIFCPNSGEGIYDVQMTPLQYSEVDLWMNSNCGWGYTPLINAETGEILYNAVTGHVIYDGEA